MSIQDSEPISVWISSLKRGSNQAAQKIWEKYYTDLVAQAHRRLGGRPRRSADEEDVVQEAFSSFFQSLRDGRFPKLRDREDLWTILFVLVDRRAKDRLRVELAEKRGGGRVRGESAVLDADQDRAGFSGFVDRPISPESIDDLISVLRASFKSLEDDELCTIAVAKLQGYQNAEIAKQQQISLRAVERKLHLVRRMFNEEAEVESSL